MTNAKWPAAVFLFLLVFGLYFNTLRAPFILDDTHKIQNNPDITSLQNFKTRLIYPYDPQNKSFERNDPSRPLTYLTFTLNYFFGKLNPLGYHLFNVFLHFLNSFLIFILAGKLLSRFGEKEASLTAFFTAVFFAVAPVNSYTVAYTYCRSDLLCAMFYLLSAVLFIEGSIASLLSFILALASKQTAATLPAVILLADYILSGMNTTGIRKRKYFHMSFWALLFAYLAFRQFYLGGVGDMEAQGTWGRMEYLLSQPFALVKYIQFILVPAGLSFDHFLVPAKIGALKIALSFAALAGIAALSAIALIKRNTASKALLLGLGWFFITVLPASSIFPTTAVIAANRAYLPAFGICLLVSFFFSMIKNRRVMAVLFCAYIALMSIVLVNRNRLYNEPYLLWQDVLSKYPDNFRAHTCLGFLYQGQRDYANASREYNKVLEMFPGYSKIHYNLGVMYQEQKRYTEALGEYAMVGESQPEYSSARGNAGSAYAALGQYSMAIREYEQAARFNTRNEALYFNLGYAYTREKRYNEAIETYKKAVEINPGFGSAYYNLACIYSIKGDKKSSSLYLESAVKINPYFGELAKTDKDFSF
ncbi:MAG: hypothetical protein A2297_06570 [Elusimicrobia bacterium RIFOXYB2_FULL_48_7]|nr:MAG: hypothetical protein A2297_06570 [Elusimicrobia bacterium RIFOXYB2_FULL_48_7]